MLTVHPRILTLTLRLIAVVQAVLGLAFLAAPETAAHALGLAPAPEWADWLFGMMAARFLGFAFGMWVAADRPAVSRSWLIAMIGIQAIDWAVTLKYLALHAVTLAQVSTAAFLPVLFIAVLVFGFPRSPVRERP